MNAPAVTQFGAADLPELRHDCIEWYENGLADSYWEWKRESVEAQAEREGVPAPHVQGLSSGVLRGTELFYVSPEMMQLAVHAARSIPDFSVQPEDLPAPDGFLYSPEPMGVLGRNDEIGGTRLSTVDHINGMCWISSPEAVFISLLYDRDHFLDQYPRSLGDQVDRLRARLPRLCELDHNSALLWNDPCLDDLNKFEEGSDPRIQPARVMKTIWLLMQQEIAATSDAQYDRATRRRLARKKIEPPRVRIINLRRASPSSATAEDAREFHYQWIVRGHWRNQYYPSRDVHRPLWIAPHVKGPSGAPLLGGEKVYSWVR